MEPRSGGRNLAVGEANAKGVNVTYGMLRRCSGTSPGGGGLFYR